MRITRPRRSPGTRVCFTGVANIVACKAASLGEVYRAVYKVRLWVLRYGGCFGFWRVGGGKDNLFF